MISFILGFYALKKILCHNLHEFIFCEVENTKIIARSILTLIIIQESPHKEDHMNVF